MNIGIDIDDTVSNTFDCAVKIASEYVKNELKREVKPYNLGKITNHSYIKTIFSLSHDEAKKFWAKNDGIIYANATVKEKAVEIVNKIRSEGNKIFFVTARYNNIGNTAYETTKKWLGDNNFHYDKLIFNESNKLQVAKDENLDIFIDDSTENCEKLTKAGIKTIMFINFFNQENNVEGAQRADSWEKIYKLIHEQI